MIRVNNNMVAWFKSGSDIRVADRVINDNLGGTIKMPLTGKI